MKIGTMLVACALAATGAPVDASGRWVPAGTAPDSTAGSAVPGPHRYQVVVGSFRSRENAQNALGDARHKLRGVQGILYPPDANDALYRVTLGASLSQPDAEALRSRAVAAGLPVDIYVVASAASAPAKPAANGSRRPEADAILRVRSRREAASLGARADGPPSSERVRSLVAELAPTLRRSTGKAHARALLELGLLQVLMRDFDPATATLEAAAREAEVAGLPDVAFEAWIGVLDADVEGPHDLAAAAAAHAEAVSSAGERPAPGHEQVLLRLQAQLELGRGELEAGIVDALQALRLASSVDDRYDAQAALADGLSLLAGTCAFRPLVDAKSIGDGGDLFAACRRARTAVLVAYEEASDIADRAGWSFLVTAARRKEADFELQWKTLEDRVGTPTRVGTLNLHPRTLRDVVVSDRFTQLESDWDSTLSRSPAFAGLVDSLAADTDAAAGAGSARRQRLKGLAVALKGEDPATAGQYFAEAASLVGAAQRGPFDPRHRGSVLDERSDLLGDLGERLLAMHREPDAFAAFESVRNRGLSRLQSALARSDMTPGDRAWLAALLLVDAKSSAIERGIVARVVGFGLPEITDADRLQLLTLREERRGLLRTHDPALRRLATEGDGPVASLQELQDAASRAGIPVLLYWSTYTDVIVWYLGPGGPTARSVFLPADALRDRVGRVLGSAAVESGRAPFDERAARELFLFLVAPFKSLLASKSIRQFLVIPQGPLIGLPFEALIDPETKTPIVERWAVSYSPNATMAAAALHRSPRPVRKVVALVDESIGDARRQTIPIESSGVDLTSLSRDEFFAGAWQGDAVHVLRHGEFNSQEPLLSSLPGTGPRDPDVLAAETLSLPLHDLSLVVLSGCKGGPVDALNSGAIYGFPWALHAGGAASTVVARWDVDDDSRGRWMRAFYKAIAAGATPANAAATAMRKMRRGGLSHPHDWAAMQVTGR